MPPSLPEVAPLSKTKIRNVAWADLRVPANILGNSPATSTTAIYTANEALIVEHNETAVAG
jgi:hypothetical protein